MTYTFAVLETSPAAFDEIKRKLIEAGHEQAILPDGTIDMRGLGLQRTIDITTPEQRLLLSVAGFIKVASIKDPRTAPQAEELLTKLGAALGGEPA